MEKFTLPAPLLIFEPSLPPPLHTHAIFALSLFVQAFDLSHSPW